MKKNLVWVLGISAAVLFTSCKSRESAYRQAFEQAMAQNNNKQNEQETVTTTETVVQPTTTITPVAPATTPVKEDHSDVREIQGDMTVISGNPLKTYSVVIGSYVTQANAEGQKQRLQAKGYDSRVVKTNETINGTTGWYRVIASSFDDKASAAQSRDALRGEFPGAWLLYRK